MSAIYHNNHTRALSLRLPAQALDLLNTYLDELIREEALNHSAEIMLRRIASPVCALAGSVEGLFRGGDRSAKGIIDCAVKIAKLSGSGCVPSGALQQTVIESIGMLRSKHVSREKILLQVHADLKSVLRLALIKVPAVAREDAANAGRISSAKIVAALMVVGHARRFDLDDELLYFSLTQWFELLVVTILQCGADSRAVKDVDRLTFTLFYLGSGSSGKKKNSFLKYFVPQLDELLDTLAPTCMGHATNFGQLKLNLQPLIRTPR